MKRIPVTLLTGFLGSGKTTLLNGLLKQPQFEGTVVIINEFGDVGLDHLLVTYREEETVMELAGGCACCTMRGDLARALAELEARFAQQSKQIRRVVCCASRDCFMSMAARIPWWCTLSSRSCIHQ